MAGRQRSAIPRSIRTTSMRSIITARRAADVIIGMTVLAAIAYTRFFTRPIYGDEGHFFANTLTLLPLSLQRLEHFDEFSSPTFFIPFAFLLKWTSASIVWCRLVVFVCFCVTLSRYARLAERHGRAWNASAAATPWTLLLLLTFPYFFSCGVYFYTDVPAMMFGLLTYEAFAQRRLLQAALWATLALHCRQFMIFVPLGLAACEVFRYRHALLAHSRQLAV